MKLWVLLFNADSENQGIYTRLEGGRDIVLAFKQEDDAIRYGGLLEAQDFPTPVAESIDDRELTEICEDSGLELKIIYEDELAIPPVHNLEKTRWEEANDRSNTFSNTFIDAFEEVDISPESLEIEIMRRKLEGLL